MKISNIILFVPVSERKKTNKKAPVIAGLSIITGNNEIRLVTFMFTNNKTKVKRKILQAYNLT